MRNQRSFRTKSRLKVVDNSVKVSQVIGKKDSNGQPFYPSFTNLTVVLVTEDKRTYETTKATADGLGNLTFLKRGLADDGTDTEVAKFKRAWMPGTLMYITFASEDYDNKPDFDDIPTKTSDLTNDSGFIDNTVNDLVNYTKTSDLGAVATSNDYNDLDNKLTAGANIAIDPDTNEISATDTIPNNATIKIQKNGTDIESFTANESTNKTINITVPTQASDVGALPDTTKYGSNLSLSINSTTYVVTAQLKDQDGNNLGTAQTIDLPLESVVVSGSYDDVNKKIVLTLQSGSTVEFSVADLVSGLQTEITSSNKLDADLVDDSTSANKFVTASDLTTLSNTSGTNTGDQTASDFDIKDLADSTSKMTGWDAKLDSGDNVSELVNDAGYITSNDLTGYQTTANMVQDLNNADHDHYPTAKAVSDAITSSGGGDMLAATYDPNNVSGDVFDMDNMVDGTNNHYITTAQQTVLNNTSGTNTGDQSATDFDIKDLSDSTNLRTAWSGKQDALTTQTAYTSKGSATKVPQITTNNLGQVTGITEVDIKSGETYVGGTGISIPNTADYSAIQGPCSNGYHIPSGEENAAIVDAMTALGINTANGACMKTYLKMPYAGYRNQANGNTAAQGTAGRYWSYLRLNANTASILAFQSNTNGNSNANAAYGMSIRPFKNEAVIPDSTWTTLFDGSLIATDAGIFHNTTDGIISVSADGTTWITIADKNLGATVVYNDGDTLSESNAGGYFQHGNNYMFPFTGSVTTSSTKVDTTGYGPGNYYSSSTFIAVSGDWSSVYNSNLWGGDTGVITVNNVIYNTGVLSVNGNTGAVTVAEFEPDNAGSTDQVLTKTADGYEWANAASGGGGTVMSETDYGQITPQNDFLYFTFE